MELLELKSIWNVVIEETISKDKMDEFVVEKSIKKESKTVLAKIKKVMYLKFAVGGLSLVLCVVMLIGSFMEPEKFTFYENILDLTDNRIFMATFILFMSMMLSWNFRAFREIKNFQTIATSVKESLGRVIGIMERTIKLNVYFGALFNAMVLGWVFYLLNNKKDFFMSTIEVVLATALVFLIGIFLFYFLSSYEQKIKFGNYLDQLKLYLKDLQEK